jgi:rubredoxin
MCPVCGADRSLFVEIDPASGEEITAPVEPSGEEGPAVVEKQWKCTLCGYIHTGDEPPETCPVCGADRSLFVEIDPASGEEITAPVEPSGEEGPEVVEKQWKCTLCGYIHTGDEPPEKCPVCGADRSLFVLLEPEKEVSAPTTISAPIPPSGKKPPEAPPPSPPATENETFYDRLAVLMHDNHAHPISVHIPNGVLPVSMFFIALATLFGSESLATAAFCNLVIVTLAMPAVLFTGYTDWQRVYGGQLTTIFKTKILCAAVVLAGSTILSIWWAVVPGVLESGASGRGFFFFLCVVVFGAAVIAGYNGGKLVFSKKK